MDNHPSRELLDNVSIPGVSSSQFIMQRMDNSQLLNTDLLPHPNGIVVDLGAGDFIPVNYSSEDLLSQDLTEEDRNLAAALVAVQLSQQQKQQLHQDASIINASLPSLVTTTSLGKESDGIDSNFFYASHDVYHRTDQLNLIKSEEEAESVLGPRESDNENRSDIRPSKKVLPHKKRISRKLKKTLATSRKLHKCNLCEQIFSSAEDFLHHQRLCETTITPISVGVPFTCQICSGVYHDQLLFFQHLKTHYEPQSVQIESTQHSIQFLKLQAGIKQQEHILSCFKCDKAFRRQETLDNHLKTFHKVLVSNNVEDKVDFNEFSEPEDLMDGIQVNTNPSAEDDSKAWYREDELHATEEDLRELEAQEYLCQVCKQQFSSRAVLQEHIMTCGTENVHVDTSKLTPAQPPTSTTNTTLTQSNGRGKGEKKSHMFNCVVCNKVFVHKNSLVYHMRGHTGTRPHQCDQCVKSFYSSSALKIHLRMHTGDKPYKCEYCGKDFRQWGDLKYHCISIHSDQRQYQCEYCGKDFARKYSLVLHRRIHTGEKNYSCEYCAKSFRASTYLKNHIRIHTGEKPYSCDICGKKFRVSSDMKRHMKTHARKRQFNRLNQSDEMVKVEENGSNDQVLVDMDENSQQRLKEEADGAVQPLSYEQDPLDSVRDNTLYVMPILIT